MTMQCATIADSTGDMLSDFGIRVSAIGTTCYACCSDTICKNEAEWPSSISSIMSIKN